MKDIDFYEEYKKYKEQNANANAKSFEDWQNEHYSMLTAAVQQELFSFVNLLNNNKWLEKYNNNFELAFYAWRDSPECPILRGTCGFCYVPQEVRAIYDKIIGIG